MVNVTEVLLFGLLYKWAKSSTKYDIKGRKERGG